MLLESVLLSMFVLCLSLSCSAAYRASNNYIHRCIFTDLQL